MPRKTVSPHVLPFARPRRPATRQAMTRIGGRLYHVVWTLHRDGDVPEGTPAVESITDPGQWIACRLVDDVTGEVSWVTPYGEPASAESASS